MLVNDLLKTENNVFYKNINILRTYLTILLQYPNSKILIPNLNKPITYLDFSFSTKDIPYDANGNIITDINNYTGSVKNHSIQNRSYDKNMEYLNFYQYEDGIVLFKLSLQDLSFQSYFDEFDEKLIKNFIASDFIIDFDKFLKSRIRKSKIKNFI